MYQGQAAEILLDAIAASDGTRESILEQLFATEVVDGIIGTFHFNENGDPQDASGAVVAFTMYKAADTMESIDSFSPTPETVKAAQGRVAYSRWRSGGDIDPRHFVF